ncbi:MAG TPA: CehA/McbA family metallohydrolase [Verrucomicrobiales bacterium]|nr:CehA/McbA family metallohydrolase [Verrucomicrobiales bacterium]
MKYGFLHLLALLALVPGVSAVPEAFEVGPERLTDLPKGKEADGIAGDCVMRNDKVELTISGNLPERRANMSGFYGADGQTPGCLYDLCLRGSANDQITIFSPAGQRGPVTWVRIVKDGKDGEAEIETVRTAANNKGLYRRHAWRLRDGMSGVEIETTLRNESNAPIKVTAEDKMTQMSQSGQFPPYTWANAVDPRDKAGYAVEAMKFEGDLPPGQERKVTRFLAVGTSPAQALGFLFEKAGGTGKVSLTLKDTQGKPVSSATVVVINGGKEAPAYPDNSGRVTVSLPAGAHELRVTDYGRPPVKISLDVSAGAATEREVSLTAPSAVVFNITEEGSGVSLPCKAQFIAKDGTPQTDLGPPNRAHGCVDQWHSETGRFTVPLAAGAYRVIVTRGPEYSHLEQDIVLGTGQQVQVAAALKRMVDTTGWVSTDFHNHSTESGDNTCGTDDRIINLAAEHIEFAVTSEHNRLYDWTPHIQKLGLTKWVSTVAGLELTGKNQHLNCFPLTPEPGRQDNGAPVWNPDPRISAIILRDLQKPDADRWVQINHPDLERVFADSDANGERDTGYFGITQYVDAWEIENYIDPGILETSPFRIFETAPSQPRKVFFNRQFIYLQLLNQGHRLRATAVADAHSVHGNGAGGWRVWLPSSTDDPSKVDWREMSRLAKAGRGVLSTGPFLEVTANGSPPGSEINAGGKPVLLKVKVQCNDWLDIDRVQVLVNGRQSKDLNFTRQSHPDWFGSGAVKFDRAIPVPLTEDAHLIVVGVNSKGTLAVGFGSSPQSKMQQIAWSNPIYVDLNGDGWKANGDTLGQDIPVKLPTVEEAERILSLTH